jgi:hypothetical protein
MLGSTEMRATKHWVRGVTVSILAFGLAATALTVQAASDDSLRASFGSAQPTGVASTPKGEESFPPEANMALAEPAQVSKCCFRNEEDNRTSCSFRISPANCIAQGGCPTDSCIRCVRMPYLDNSEGGVDTTGDDSPATEPADSSPLNTGAGSIWALLVVTMFVAGL